MPSALVGRDDELRELGEALEQLMRGRGGLHLLVGEAGVGKSRIAVELAERANAAGVGVAFGHCWESGGAPAFWPWTQVLRALMRRDPRAFERRRERLLPLLPELDAAAPAAVPAVEAEQARFLLMDAVVSSLVELVSREPLLLVFEDLHAADPSSLALLELLAQQLRTSPLGVVGTARDTPRSGTREGLSRLARVASSLPLGRLDPRAAAELLASVLGREPTVAEADGVYASTEGNPLYVVEVARRLRAGDLGDRQARALPPNVRAMIRDNLLRLPPAVLQTLEAASVLGRELDEHQLEQLLEAEPHTALELAADQGLVEAAVGRRWRFSHILVRDVLEDALEPGRSRRLHARAAQVLEAGASSPPWPQLAHHLLRAGPEQRVQARAAARRAGEQSLAQLAFDEAARWFDAAIGTLSGDPAAGPRERGELLIARGRGELLAGDRSAGAASCAEARGLARSLGDAELFAHACLAAGSVITVAVVNDELVGCLREALERLPPQPSALRARVEARLAAGLQPAHDPSGPIAMALEAIASARALGDRRVLLETLRSGMAALQDLAPPEVRLPLNREHLALAFELGEAAHAFCALTRVVFDHFELGEVAAALEAIGSADALARELAHPSFLWQAEALQALYALCQRRFDQADEHAARAREAAERARDPNAVRTLLVQRVRRLELEGRIDEAVTLLPELRTRLVGTRFGQLVIEAWEASLLAKAGAPARVEIPRASVEAMLQPNDPSLLELLSEYAIHTRQRGLCAELRERVLGMGIRSASWGAFGMVVGGPLAELAAALARAAEPSTAEPPRRTGLVSEPELRIERAGDYWRIMWGERELLVEHRRGLEMLARLVEERGRELHVFDLAGVPADGSLVERGDAGEQLDQRARAEYRARVRELRAELEDAERSNDAGHAARARNELELIERELARAFGLGGRERRSGAAVERARINVQRRLKDAIRRITEHDGQLGKHLDRSVRTGLYCRYDP